MNEQDTTLRVENVSKRYDDFTAVRNLSFDVRAGRVFGFLGPNGAGKTTTIRMIVAPGRRRHPSVRRTGLRRGAKPHRLSAGRTRSV